MKQRIKWQVKGRNKGHRGHKVSKDGTIGLRFLNCIR